MNILLWLGIGLIAGGFASRYLDDSLEETILDIFLGVVGALFSGYLFYKLGTPRPEINLFQLFTIILSAIVVIWFRNNLKSSTS